MSELEKELEAKYLENRAKAQKPSVFTPVRSLVTGTGLLAGAAVVYGLEMKGHAFPPVITGAVETGIGVRALKKAAKERLGQYSKDFGILRENANLYKDEKAVATVFTSLGVGTLGADILSHVGNDTTQAIPDFLLNPNTQSAVLATAGVLAFSDGARRISNLRSMESTMRKIKRNHAKKLSVYKRGRSLESTKAQLEASLHTPTVTVDEVRVRERIGEIDTRLSKLEKLGYNGKEPTPFNPDGEKKKAA